MIHPNQNFLNNFNNIQAVSEKQDLTNKLPENRKASTAPLMLIEDVKAKLQKALKEKENIQVKITEEAKPEEITTQKVIVEQVLPEIKTEGPLVYKNGVLSLDSTELKTALAGYSQQFLQDAVTKFTANSTPGGGAVGIKYNNSGNIVSLSKSVSDIIFTGPGVEVTKQGKNVQVYISGMDPNLDFAREATVLELVENITQIYNDVSNLQNVVYVSSYNSIGGTSGSNYWNVWS
jgi:hypothetical protein